MSSKLSVIPEKIRLTRIISYAIGYPAIVLLPFLQMALEACLMEPKLPKSYLNPFWSLFWIRFRNVCRKTYCAWLLKLLDQSDRIYICSDGCYQHIDLNTIQDMEFASDGIFEDDASLIEVKELTSR